MTPRLNPQTTAHYKLATDEFHIFLVLVVKLLRSDIYEYRKRSGIPGKFAKVDPVLWYLVEARLTVNNYALFYLPDFVNIVTILDIY